MNQYTIRTMSKFNPFRSKSNAKVIPLNLIEPTEPDRIYNVDTDYLTNLGWEKWSWRLHTRKANVIFLLLFSLITYLTVLIILLYANGDCSQKKQLNIALISINAVLVVITYTLIWPHTQYRANPANPSRFTGHSQIAMQQHPNLFQG